MKLGAVTAVCNTIILNVSGMDLIKLLPPKYPFQLVFREITIPFGLNLVILG